MFGCPVIYFEKNMIFDNTGSCWGVYKLNGFNYDNRSDESKIEIWKNLTRVIATVPGEAKVLVIPSVLDLDEHYRRLEKTLHEKDPLHGYAMNHAELTKQYLKSSAADCGGNANDYHTYLIVKLVEEGGESDILDKIKHFMAFLFKDPMNAIDSLMKTDYKDILQSRVNYYEKLADNFLFEQNKRLAMRAASTTDIQFLLKRAAYKGMEHAVRLNVSTKIFGQGRSRRKITSDWTPYAERNIIMGGRDTAVRPYFKDVSNLFRGVIRTKDTRMLTVEHDSGEVSYQTYLVITHIPDIDFPDNEWIYLLQNLDVQAEICIHFANVEHREALRKLDFKKREINSQMDNVVEAHADMPEDLMISRDEADMLEGELKESRLPMTKACVSICLYGTDPEEVERKAEFVKQTYSDMNYTIERPIADQLTLFFQHIPGAGFYIKDYNMMLTPMTLAGGVIGASNELGDTVGAYIGTTGRQNKPVFLDLGLACRMNMSAAATLFGNLGVGKSFFANLLALLTVIYGGYALIFDPKGERSHWQDSLTMLRGMITTVTLAPDRANRGKLDPFIIYRNNFTAAAELAMIVVTELFGLLPKDEEYTALQEAIGTLRNVSKPCMSKLCAVLGSSFNNEEERWRRAAQDLARRLKNMRAAGFSSLLFGTGDEEAISLENRMTIIQIQNLKLPSPETKKDDYTVEESLSTVLMIILGNFAKKFAHIKRNVFSVVLFDESWALGKTAEGRKLYDYLSRMGRSLYTGCIFNGHSVLDIPLEGIKNTITHKFCFKTGNRDEATRMLEYLLMEVTDDNIQLLMGLGNAQCVYKDMYGRIGVLQFDAVFEDIIQIFSTTPKTREEEAGTALPAKPQAPAADDDYSVGADDPPDDVPDDSFIPDIALSGYDEPHDPPAAVVAYPAGPAEELLKYEIV